MPHGLRALIENVRSKPDASAARERYRVLAKGYDRTTRWSEQIRAATIEAAALRPGDTVLDVACGTGLSFASLAERVGPTGRIVGIDQCPHMIALAAARCRDGNLPQVDLVNGLIETARFDCRFDAIVFCYTHDVLQAPAALRTLFAAAQPRARVAVAGLRLLPWLWGGPLNTWNLYRTAPYLTTFSGLRAPWAPLLEFCPNLEIVRTFWCGAYYVATGVVAERRARDAPRAHTGVVG